MLPDHLPFLLDHCLAGLYVLSGERIVWLNARAAELVGCKPEEMVGGSFLEFVYPPDLSLLRAAETEGPYVIRAVRRDGQRGAALRQDEGWGPRTSLRDALLEETGAKDADDLMHRFYSPEYPRSRVATWSKSFSLGISVR